MIAETARCALNHWGLADAECRLIAQRENVVFRVTDAHGARFALRLHRPGYQTLAMLRSELAWIRHLGAHGLNVPWPIQAKTGEDLIEIDGFHTDLLTWLNGAPMGSTGTPLVLKDREGTFRRVGALMARLHRISDDWDPPVGFERQRWDLDGLLGETPLWGRFWENPGLSAAQRDRVLLARERLRRDLTDGASDFGLIHADMLRENIMIDGDQLGLIDFDDSGFGYRLFDVATALFKNRSEPDYEALQAAFVEGYQQVRSLDTTLLDHFILIRALSYLGWIIARIYEPGSRVRQDRFMKSSLPLVDAFLNSTEEAL